MRIHIFAPGFTPEVFTAATGPMFRIGVDKLISLHTSIPDKVSAEKVEKTLTKVEEATHFKAERKNLHSTTFQALVEEVKTFLSGFGDGDEIYLHLEGGKRHIGLALVFASFFVRKKIHLVVPTDYGTDGKDGLYESMPPIPAIELTDKQLEALRLVASKEGQTLTQIAERVNNDDPTKVAPGIFRQLQSLSRLNLVVALQNGKKTYAVTESGRLFL